MLPSYNRVFPLTAKAQPTLRDMPSVTMFARAIVNQVESKYQANIVPGPSGTGTSGILGTLGDINF